MMQELADKIWNNPRFQEVMLKVEVAWLLSELRQQGVDEISRSEIGRALQAAAALASSSVILHRKAAYRLATSIYELFHGADFRLDKPLRVILTRLDNFPSLQTKSDIAEAGERLPLSLLMEEMELAHDRRVVFGGRDILLTRFQYQLWQRLSSKHSTVVSAPTSAGKSFVLQNFLLDYYRSNSTFVFYIVPTRALISQVSSDLRDAFEGYEGSVPEICTLPIESDEGVSESTVFVMTQERVQLLLLQNPLIKPSVVIVDEAHSISDGSRGVLLQNVIDDLILRNANAQFMFASPLIKNLDVFGRVFDRSQISELSTDEPTVGQNFIRLSLTDEYDEVLRVGLCDESGKYSGDITKLRLLPGLTTRVDRLAWISTKLGVGTVNIIYTNGADEAERAAIAIAKILDDRSTTFEREELAQLAMETVHEKYKLADCVRKGVAFHYGEVPSNLRRAIEEGVSSGVIDYLVCTSTLLQGVNLPARNIFLYKPERGSNRPLEATDFWNLSGRAGRLLREFKGNIYLINYDDWKVQPLGREKKSEVVPAIESVVSGELGNLLALISDENGFKCAESSGLESVFVRLFSDSSFGRLQGTLARAGVDVESDVFANINQALDVAKAVVKLPGSIIKLNSNISPYKQQALFDEIYSTLVGSTDGIQDLIPVHPKHPEAYSFYVKIFQMCHRNIGGLNESLGISKFHALIALRWMRGWPLPQIIDKQIERESGSEIRSVIRKSLGIIEQDMRYQAVRYFTCYLSLVRHAAELAGVARALDGIIPIVLFLEVGASDATSISFISHGLSRATSRRLADKSKSTRMTPSEAKSWLMRVDLMKLDLPSIMMAEVIRVMRGWS